MPDEIPTPIPESALENGYYWALRGTDDLILKQPVWVGFIKNQPRVWAIGRSRPESIHRQWSILEKIEG